MEDIQEILCLKKSQQLVEGEEEYDITYKKQLSRAMSQIFP